MSRPTFDIVVFGAGLAGTLAARQLALRGRSVLLVERQAFPRDKVCGCCLNHSALAQLAAVGLADLPARLGARPLHRLNLITPRRRAELDLPPGVAVSRRALDAAMVEAAVDAGVTFRDQTAARVLRTDAMDGSKAVPVSGTSGSIAQTGSSADPDRDAATSGRHLIRLGSQELVEAAAVVVADGLAGTSLRDWPEFATDVRSASRMGLGGVTRWPVGAELLGDGRIAMACGKRGYLGAVRLEDGRIDFAAACEPALIKSAGGIGEAALQIAAEAGVAELWPLQHVEHWRATPALTRRRTYVAAPGLFVVGDAAGYVEPFTGEGMAWALAGGAAVAPFADAAASRWHPAQAAGWAATYRQKVMRRQVGCRAVAAVLRRSRLTSMAVHLLAALPQATRPLVRRFTAPAAVDAAEATQHVGGKVGASPVGAACPPATSGSLA